MIQVGKVVRRIRRHFYLQYPFEAIRDENLPVKSAGYKKRICQNEKYHVGRVAEIMAVREANKAETKVFTIGSNVYGQCGILGKVSEVRQIPVDNLHSKNFRKNQERLEQTGQKWNLQFKSVLAGEAPTIVDEFTNPLAINRYGKSKIKVTNIAAGRQMSLIMGRQDENKKKPKWTVLGSGVNQYGQLGQHLTHDSPVDTSGQAIKEQFDEKGNCLWAKGKSDEDEAADETVLGAFRPIPFHRDCGIPRDYKPLSVSAGGAHCAVVFGHVDYDASGTPQENIARAIEYPNFVVTLGNNDFGQCGVEDERYSNYNIIDDLQYHDGDRHHQWHPFKTVCGESHTIFLSRRIGMRPTRGWRVFTCGLNDDGQLGQNHFDPVSTPQVIDKLPPMSQISSKSDFCLGLDTYDNIWGWGSNVDGVFGSFTEELTISRPYLLTQKRFNSYLDSPPVMVAAGSRAGILLTAKKTVYTFGTGLLGYNGETRDVMSAMPIPVNRDFFAGSKPSAVFAGADVFGVITDIGELYTWGKSDFNSIGLYEESSKPIQPFPWRASKGLTFKNVLDVDFGVDHLVTLTAI